MEDVFPGIGLLNRKMILYESWLIWTCLEELRMELVGLKHIGSEGTYLLLLVPDVVAHQFHHVF